MSALHPCHRIRSIVVAPTGELDIADSHGLREHLTDALDESAHVVLDLHQVTFIDSTILSAILEGHQLAQSRGSRLTIVGVIPRVAKLFRVTQLDRVLELRENASLPD